jgi:hypothetical protein
MTSTIKVNTVKDTASTDIIKKCGTSITVGTASDTTTVAGNAVRSNAIQASDGQNIISQVGTTITLGATGDNIVLAGGATQSGFGRTGTVDWQTTPKTATFTAVSGEGYFANTTGSAFNMNLPAGVAGAIVSVADYAATFQTTNLTVVPNGTDKIGSLNQNATLNVEGQSVTFVFVDSTQGWINTMDSTSNVRGAPPFICASVSGACNTLLTAADCGNYKVATFTGPGNFTVNSVATSAPDNIVDYLIVAGGGSGANGNGNSPGGGGAGGARASATTYTNAGPSSPRTSGVPGITVTAQAYPIVVGAGDAGQAGPNPSPGTRRGSDSSGLSLTATGGGAGAYHGGGGGCGNSGGSGGGASGGGLNKNAGAGNTPPVSPSQGSIGGARPGSGPDGSGGAGGGFMAAGTDAQGPGGNPYRVAPGGAGGGFPNSFGTSGENCGSYYYFGGGGGGAGSQPTPAPVANAAGGIGGGGGISTTTCSPSSAGTPGTVNTGGGGGGSNNDAYPVVSASGGSGIVIIRYKFQ